MCGEFLIMPEKKPIEPRPIADRLVPRNLEPWNSRLFSRIGVDTPISAPLMLSLTKANQDFGFGMYQPKTTGASNEAIPVFVDEPLQPQAMRDARWIEFQFLPSTAERKHRGTWRGDWKPTLASDIVQANSIADRVALARNTSHRADVAIGAAIAAASVAEDMRFFIECGFDYVCLILDGCFDTAPGHRLSLAQANDVIEIAQSVRDQSARPGFGIRIAAHAFPHHVAQWLCSGIDAVAIDAWLQDRAPVANSPMESFAGILIETAKIAPGNSEWLYNGIRDFIAELNSEQQFFEG
jgi:hypothetical protein